MTIASDDMKKVYFGHSAMSEKLTCKEYTFSSLYRDCFTSPRVIKSFTPKAWCELPKKTRDIAKNGRYLIPSAMKHPLRSGIYAEYINFYIFDIEKSDDFSPDFLPRNLRWFIHTTASHTPEKPRYHLFFDTEPFLSSHYRDRITALADRFSIPLTRESGTAVQPMFLPALPKGMPYYSHYNEGVPLKAEAGEQPQQTIIESTPQRIYEKPPLNITDDQVVDAISVISPDVEYPVWRDIASALRHQYQDDPDKGFMIFDQWSSYSPKYNRKQSTEELWNKLKPFPSNPDTEPITFAYVLRITKEIISETPPEKINKNYFKTLVWVIEKGVYYDWPTRTTIKLSHVNASFNHIIPPASKANAATILARSDIPRVSDFIYLPCKSVRFPPILTIEDRQYLNTYSLPTHPEFSIKQLDFVSETLDRHFNWLFGSNQIYKEIYLSFLSYPIQTGDKVQWCPVVQGVSGSGKSIISDVIANALGPRNVSKLIPSTLKGEFSGWAGGKQFIFVDEMQRYGNLDLFDKLRTFISEKGINPNRKHENTGDDIPNVTTYAMFTEHRSAVPIEENDRRYVPFWAEVDDKVQVDRHFARGGFDNMYELRKPEFSGAVYQYFTKYPIRADFNPAKAPLTEFRDSMRPLAQTEIGLMIEDLVESNFHPLVNDYLIAPQALRESLSYEFPHYRFNYKTVVAELIERKYRKIEQRIEISKGGPRHTIYISSKVPPSISNDRLLPFVAGKIKEDQNKYKQLGWIS